jgi:hypothetical protein
MLLEEIPEIVSDNPEEGNQKAYYKETDPNVVENHNLLN